jgi:hypothetical protein
VTASASRSDTGATVSGVQFVWSIGSGAGIVEIRDVNNTSNATQNTNTITTGTSGIYVVPLSPGTATIRCRVKTNYGSTSNLAEFTVNNNGELSSISLVHSSGKGSSSSNRIPITVRDDLSYSIKYNAVGGGYVHSSRAGIAQPSISSSYGSLSSWSQSAVCFSTGYNATNGSVTVTSSYDSNKTATSYFSISGPTNGVSIANGSSLNFIDIPLVQNNTTGKIIAGYCVYDAGSTTTLGYGVDFPYSNSSGHTVWLIPILISSWSSGYKYAGLPTSRTSELNFSPNGSSLKGIYMPDSITGTHNYSYYSYTNLNSSQTRVSPNLKFMVTWDSGGGTSYDQSTLYWGNTISSPGSPSYTGASFTGWYTGISSGSALSGTISNLKTNYTYYARYTLSGTISFSSAQSIQDTQNEKRVRATIGASLQKAPNGKTRSISVTWDNYGYCDDESFDSSGHVFAYLYSPDDEPVTDIVTVTVWPASGERATGTYSKTYSVSLTKLNYPNTYVKVKTGLSGYVKMYANRNRVSPDPTATQMHVWATSTTDDVITTPGDYKDNNDHYFCNWSGWLISNNATHKIYAYNYCVGYIDSLISHTHDVGSTGSMDRTNYSVY